MKNVETMVLVVQGDETLVTIEEVYDDCCGS